MSVVAAPWQPSADSTVARRLALQTATRQTVEVAEGSLTFAGRLLALTGPMYSLWQAAEAEQADPGLPLADPEAEAAVAQAGLAAEVEQVMTGPVEAAGRLLRVASAASLVLRAVETAPMVQLEPAESAALSSPTIKPPRKLA